MLHNIRLNAGLYTELAGDGRFINVVLAAGEIQARMRLRDGSSFQTKLISGMAFELPSGFVSAAFLSEISQQTKVWLSNLPLTFSPSESKVVGSSGLTSTSTNLSFGTTAQLALADATRKSVTLYSEQEFYVGGLGLNSKNAIKVKGGETKTIGTQAAIYAFTDNPAYFGQPMGQFSLDSIIVESVATTSGGLIQNEMGFLDSVNQLIVVQNENINMFHGDNLAGVATSYDADNNMTILNKFDKSTNSYIYGSGVDLVTVNLLTQEKTSAPLLGFPAISGAGMELARVNIEGNFIFCFDGNFKPYAGTISGGVAELIMPFAAYNFLLLKNGRLAIMQGTKMAVTTDSTYSAFGPVLQFPVSYNGNVCNVFDSEEGAIYVSIQTRYLYKSLDYGVSWEIVGDFIGEKVRKIIAVGGYVTVATDVAVYQSVDSGKNFDYRKENTLTGINNMIFSGSGDLYLAGIGGGLARLSGQAKTIGGLTIAVMSEVN